MLFQSTLPLWENRITYYAVRCKSDSSDAPVDVVNRRNILWWDLVLHLHNYHQMIMIMIIPERAPWGEFSVQSFLCLQRDRKAESLRKYKGGEQHKFFTPIWFHLSHFYPRKTHRSRHFWPKFRIVDVSLMYFEQIVSYVQLFTQIQTHTSFF